MKRTISLIGGALLIFGCFLPIIHAPIIGSISWVLNGKGDGIIVVGLALVGLVLASRNLVGWASIAAWVSLAMMLYLFTNVQSKMSNIDTTNPFARALASTITLGEAWPVMLIGAGAMIVASFLKNTNAAPRIPDVTRLAKRTEEPEQEQKVPSASWESLGRK
jgi:hypothetical protein